MYNHELLREARDARGLDNRDIANMKGLHESTVSRYLSGEIKKADFDTIADICDALGISMDPVGGRSAIPAYPTIEGQNITENLVILRDFTRGNFERLRIVELEKDAAFNRHIDHLKEQLDEKASASASHIEHLKEQLNKYSQQFTRYNNTIIALVCLCGLLLGMMITMFVNNRALQSQIKDLQDNLAEYHHEYLTEDDFPTE